MIINDPFAPTEKDQDEAAEWLGNEFSDVGCGPNPHPRASLLYDWKKWDNNRIEITDFLEEDFLVQNVYCRHVIEDLRYPELLFKQFAHTNRGWIETPHPTVEYTRNVDRGAPWRGFFHHHWFVWVEEDTLILCPKYVIVEYIDDIGPMKQWNTYYKWKDYNFKYKVLRDQIDFDVTTVTYYETLKRGCNA